MKAVVFIDVQNDFIDGALRNERAIEVTPKIVEWAKELMVGKPEYKFYATRDTHERTKHRLDYNDPVDPGSTLAPVAGYLSTLEGRKLPVEHCIELTDGWMINYRLMNVLDGGVTIINKPTFGSFDLAEIILEDQIKNGEKYDEIILCGFCTDICVISNALILRAKFPNTKITIKKDLCAGVSVDTHEAALKTAQMCQIDVE